MEERGADCRLHDQLFFQIPAKGICSPGEEQHASHSYYHTHRELGRMKTGSVALRDGVQSVLVGSVGEATEKVQYAVRRGKGGALIVLDDKPEAVTLSSSFVVHDSSHRRTMRVTVKI